VPACLLVGALIGAAQGYWIAYWKIPSFVVTLAGMLVFRGLTLALLAGQSIGPFPRSFQALSSGFIPDPFGLDFRLLSLLLGVAVGGGMIVFGLRSRAKQARFSHVDEPLSFFLVKNGIIAAAIVYITYLLATYNGLPNVLITMAVLIAAYSFFTTKSVPGRRIYAIGGNEKAAKLSGIKTERLTFLTFANMGMLAALAGLIFAARLNTATPKAGVAFELDVIAAVFIGGMNNGMSIMGVGIDWQQVIKGLVLLAAVIFDVYNKSKGES
jgi:putative multiple sugar transport system permease protein